MFLTGNTKFGTISKPFAIETWCGWVVSGAHHSNDYQNVSTYVLPTNVENCEEIMSPQGVPDESTNTINAEELSVVKQFKNNVTYKNGRYEMPLLVKPYARGLPDAYHLALKRF